MQICLGLYTIKCNKKAKTWLAIHECPPAGKHS